MLGLIKKDLLIIINNFKQYLIFILIFIFFAFNGIETIIYFPTLVITMILCSTFNYDDMSKWNSYAIASSITRKEIVTSKYIENIIYSVAISLFTVLFTLLISLINPINLPNIIISTLGSLIGVILLFSLGYPLIFKFGAEKGRIFLVILIFSIAILIGILISIFGISPLIKSFASHYLYLILILGPIILYIISYLISLRIYLKKDF